MTPNDATLALVFVLIFLSPLALVGVALINTGLGRSRSAAQALLGNLAILTVAALAFVVLGSVLVGHPGGAGGWAPTLAGKTWNLFGGGHWLLAGFGAAQPLEQAALFFLILNAAMAAILPWGSGADRLRLTAGLALAALLGGVIFPVAAHWVWAGGWLAQLDANFHLGANTVDAAGAGVVHMLGGFSALALIWVAGPRKGKFPKEGLSTALPGHNAVYVLFGCLLALVGFLAWNGAGALLWMHQPLAALPLTALNTLLAAAAALSATFIITTIRFGKPDASLCANGWMTGLVASGATAALAAPWQILLIGAAAGAMTPLLVEGMELVLSIDDPSGAVTVHGMGGLLGVLAAGLLLPQPGALVAELLLIAAILGLLFPLLYLLFELLDHYLPFRVDPDGERLGMDLHELGGGAYPEFVIHRDESYR